MKSAFHQSLDQTSLCLSTQLLARLPKGDKPEGELHSPHGHALVLLCSLPLNPVSPESCSRVFQGETHHTIRLASLLFLPPQAPSSLPSGEQHFLSCQGLELAEYEINVFNSTDAWCTRVYKTISTSVGHFRVFKCLHTLYHSECFQQVLGEAKWVLLSHCTIE